MKKYNILWNKIKQEDRPKPGEIYMCLDPQKRLGDETWSVGVMGDGSMTRDSISLGLFWDNVLAESFMVMSAEFESVRMLQSERGFKQ